MSAAGRDALLLACLHQDPQQLAEATLPEPESERWDGLLELAARQRVRPLVHRSLKALAGARPVPDRILRELEQATRRTGLRNLRFLGELAAIARSLAAQDVAVLILKGAHLAAAIYENVALRDMSDIDILVQPAHLQRAVGAATARGYGPVAGGAIDVDPAIGHHLARLLKPDVASIEIHWSITPPADAHAIDPGSLWQRATPVTVAGTGLLALCPEDLLLHLCFHASYQHQFRFGLRPFCDIAATIARERDRIDWDALVERTREWHWNRGVYLTLRLAHEMVGADVPRRVLDALEPAGFDATVSAAANAHVLTESSSGLINPGVARLGGTETVGTRLRFLRARVLPPREELARLYGLPPTSARVPLFYLHRATDMVRRHGVPAARLLLRKDRALTEDATRAHVLRRWLDS